MGDSTDPFEMLKQHDVDAGAPLPAAEVRARGDRMRRRRTAFRAVAAAAAVAVVTTGGVVIGEQLSGSTAPLPPASQAPEPSGAPQPTPTVPPTTAAEPAFAWRTEIPENFPLDLGYPEPRFDETELVGPKHDYQPTDHIGLCGEVAFPSEPWSELLGTSFSQPEDTRHRMLTTYPDAATARKVVARLVDTYRACPRETDDSGWALVTELRDVEPGEEGYVAIQHSELDGAPAPGLGLTHLVRVGNAVLLHITSNEGGGNERQVYAQVLEQTRLVAELAEEMCIFSADGCSSPVEDAKSKAAAEAAEGARRATFGPEGVAGVHLGMSLEELAAIGGGLAEPFHGGDCAPIFWPTGAESPEITGILQRGLGVVSLSTSGDARTPEDITMESTLGKVTSTYPGGRWFDPTYVTPVPGQADRQYEFVFAGGEATGILTMRLHLRDSSCSSNITGR